MGVRGSVDIDVFQCTGVSSSPIIIICLPRLRFIFRLSNGQWWVGQGRDLPAGHLTDHHQYLQLITEPCLFFSLNLIFADSSRWVCAVDYKFFFSLLSLYPGLNDNTFHCEFNLVHFAYHQKTSLIPL